MRDAAADLDFETAARLRDEIKRLKEVELAVADDPLAKEPALPSKGGRSESAGLFRKPHLDEMTVGRTETPLGEDARPVRREKVGKGSYEDPAEARRAKRRPGKTGRPGR